MYCLDGRWRRQSLVYFGRQQDSSANVVDSWWFRQPRGCVPPPQPVKIRPRRTSTSIVAEDLRSHQSKYVWFWETSAPGQVDPRRNTSSCSNPPKASGDVHGPLKTLATRPISSRFCIVENGFYNFAAPYCGPRRGKLPGASRTVQSTYQQRVARYAARVSATAWK